MHLAYLLKKVYDGLNISLTFELPQEETLAKVLQNSRLSGEARRGLKKAPRLQHHLKLVERSLSYC